MKTKQWKKVSIIISFLALAAIALSGCSGSDGAAGAAGATGATGATGAAGPTGPAAGTDASVMSLTELGAVLGSSTATVDSVTIASPPVVKFTVKDANGNGISGLGKRNTSTVPALLSLRFGMAKLVPGANGSPSKWVNYIVTTAATPPALRQPTTDREGTLVDNGDGSYIYTFYRDLATIKDTAGAEAVTYDGTLTHRLVLTVTAGTDPPAGEKYPNNKNVIFDFTIDPATKAAIPLTATSTKRDIITTEKCNKCHGDMSKAFSGPDNDGGHFDTRPDVRNCITCHNDQQRYAVPSALIVSSTNGAFPTLTATQRLSTNRQTQQPRIGDGEVMLDMPIMIHKLHMGSDLKKTYDYFDGVAFNTKKYPQDIQNCRTCHSGDTEAELAAAPQGNNWKNVPSRLACGSCHDNINWATGGDYFTGGSGHPGIGGAQATDANCTLCHQAAYIESVHVRNPAATPKYVYEISSVTVNATTKLPEFKFRILKNGTAVTLNTFDAAVPGGVPLTGTDRTSPYYTSAGTPQTTADSVHTIIQHYGGYSGPSFYVAYGIADDVVTGTSFADFNAGTITAATAAAAAASGVIGSGSAGTVSVSLANVWNGTVGKLSARDADGYYTATLGGGTYNPLVDAFTNAAGVTAAERNADANAACVIPTSAKMVTGMIGGSFSEGGAYSATTKAMAGSAAQIAKQAVKVATGYTARRAIVSDSKCNDCHAQLGTVPSFHSGARNDGSACVVCHNPSRNSSSWASNAKDFVHSIHAGSIPLEDAEGKPVPGDLRVGIRTNDYGWHSDYAYWNVAYPRKRNNCEACHVAGTYDFSASAYTDPLLNNLLPSTASTTDFVTLVRKAGVAKVDAVPADATTTLHVGSTTPAVSKVTADLTGTAASLPALARSPLLTVGNYYGTTAQTVAPLVTAAPNRALNLVISPISAACFACHDSSGAVAHMKTNGGTVYEARTLATAGKEACLACHGAGKDLSIADVHK